VEHPNVSLVRRVAESISAREVDEYLIGPDVRVENVRTAVTREDLLRCEWGGRVDG
jgi:hypothetical protein